MRMKHSIRRRMTVMFSAILLSTLLLCWLINNFFLETYYVLNKQEVLVQVYENLDSASSQGILETEDYVQQLNPLCENNNISLFVMGTDGREKLYSMRDFEIMKRNLYNYLFRGASDKGIIEKNDVYTLRMNHDIYMNEEYLEMLGILNGGEYFFIRTALEPIRESVELANRFMAYVGIAAILIGAFLIRLMSRRIAEPLMELAELSERMSNLDFNVKFFGSRDDEITFLGQHMNQLSEALEKTISELKTANNELQRDIEQREKNDEMRKEFLSNVSHELKTPIALIQGYAEGLQECINEDAQSREFYCEVIVDEAAKMNAMVKNLLNLNELEFGNEVVTMERFDITTMIKNLLLASKILFEQKQVKVVFDDTVPVFVWANEFKIEEVLNNYISNALNHVEGENMIQITLQQKDSLVRVGVFNTGKPIPEQDVGLIWDKFYKVDKARTREYGGSGVGLSIVKAIMESMHRKYGVINYENGVEFWVELDSEASVQKMGGQENGTKETGF